MPPEQKQAVFIVFSAAASVILFALLIPLMGMKIAPVAFGLMGLCGLAPLLFPRKRKSGEVAWDERDEVVAKKATRSGAMCSYSVFIAGCIVPWSIFREMGKEEISIHVLPWIAGAGIITFFVSRSITLLVLYGRGGQHGQE